MKIFSIRLGALDIAAPIITIGVALLLAFLVYGNNIKPSLVSIRSESGTKVYPLDTERRIEVQGPIGTTVVQIDKNGAAAVVESPCPNKHCIHAGQLKTNGDWSACMPNKVFVRIEGGEEKEEKVDASVY